ncbi:uncharacterized protein [Miscanthus floridulus]|uniref:uncharacterized protein n=1 Tax=Miscanthus floridulus TaxID=154761 RepID=UPI0034583C51
MDFQMVGGREQGHQGTPALGPTEGERTPERTAGTRATGEGAGTSGRTSTGADGGRADTGVHGGYQSHEGGSRDVGARQHWGWWRESGHRSARQAGYQSRWGGSTSTNSKNPSYQGKGNDGGNPSRRGERRRAGQETDRGLEADRGRYDATEVGHGGGGGRAQRR